eukprot:11183464-Lingulodinium_polyedra.AAC.1
MPPSTGIVPCPARSAAGGRLSKCADPRGGREFLRGRGEEYGGWSWLVVAIYSYGDAPARQPSIPGHPSSAVDRLLRFAGALPRAR